MYSRNKINFIIIIIIILFVISSFFPLFSSKLSHSYLWKLIIFVLFLLFLTPYRQCLLKKVSKEFEKEIEEKRMIEQKLKDIDFIFNSLLEHSPIYIFFKDHEIRPMYLSRNYEKMLGMPLKKIIGKTMDELFPSDLAKNMINDDKKILAKNKVIIVDESLDGRYFKTIKFPISQDNKAPMLAGFTLDITDIKEAQMALEYSENRLRELNATKDKMFSIIAHDLKNPMASILSFTNYLIESKNKYHSKEQNEHLKLINYSIKNTYQLLENLLAWTRSQTGKLEFISEPVNLYRTLQRIVTQHDFIAKRKNIVIQLKVEKTTTIYADNNSIETILRNLLSNALKFSKSNQSIIIESSNMSQGDKSKVKISFTDFGVGIPKNIINRLFKSDNNVSTKGTEYEKGSGLGLLLCKEFVQANGGDIGILSNPGQKTVVWFTVPSAP